MGYTNKDTLKMLEKLSEEELDVLLHFFSIPSITYMLNDKEKYMKNYEENILLVNTLSKFGLLAAEKETAGNEPCTVEDSRKRKNPIDSFYAGMLHNKIQTGSSYFLL